MKKRNLTYISFLLLVALGSCKKNYIDTAGPSSTQALSSPNALTDVAVGLQNWYTNNRGGIVYNTITADGLLTNQLYCVNAGNTDEAQLGTGAAAVLNTNGMVTGLWSASNKIIYDANRVLAQAPKIVTDKNYLSGVIAYTSIFKALAIADMATFWDHVPAGVGSPTNDSTVNFETSAQGYADALAVINNAITTVNGNSISTAFLANTPNTIDIVNTLYALKARYSLFAGNYADALAAAQQVNRSVKSAFGYNTVVTNPIFTLATSTNNIFQPVDSTMGLPVGLQPDAGDKREPFYIAIGANPRYRLNGFFNGTTAAIPVYLPGEMMLIMAECYTRNNDLVNGANWLDSVVVKQPAKDPWALGAALPGPVTYTSQADLLNQIYKHRGIELFMSGLRLADQRRFGRPQSERRRSWFPYPFVERNGNPNTPPDPTF